MNKSYPFPTYSGLLEPKHYKKIGSAIWLFLWCVSSTTSEKERDGITWGIVLGNRPLKLSEISSQFDVDEKTVRRWMKTLESNGYIRITRVPYGIILTVKNSKKFNKRVGKDVQTGTDKNVHSLEKEWTHMPNLPDKNVHSNKDITQINKVVVVDVDKSGQKCPDEKMISELNYLENEFCKLHGKLDIHVRASDIQAMNRLISGGVPSSFIISTMRALYQQKQSMGENVKYFTYYEEPIKAAWEKEKEKQKVGNGDDKNGITRRRNETIARTDQSIPDFIAGQIGRLKKRKTV